MAISTANPTVATLTRYRYVATGGETSISGVDANGNVLSYTAGFEQVYLNGVLLVRGQNYTATNGSSITGLTALAASDSVEVLTFSPFTITNAVDQTLVNAKGDLIVATGDNVVTNVAVGTNNQTLLADSAQASGVKWGASSTSTLTTKGDLLGASAANTLVRIAVGTSSSSAGALPQTIIADSTTTSGIAWSDNYLVLDVMQAI